MKNMSLIKKKNLLMLSRTKVVSFIRHDIYLLLCEPYHLGRLASDGRPLEHNV